MTHDELLAKINDFNSDEGIAIAIGDINNALYALRAVVELHRPHEITLPNGDWGMNCILCDGYYYPCYTIDTIEKELG